MPTSFSYKNPLDNFASYSVHYIMLASRTTKLAQDFVDSGKNANTLAAIDKVSRLGELVPYGPASTAYLILDTRRFSQFTIEKLKYDVRINGVEIGRPPTNFATHVEATVIDSVGISFINFLQWLMNEQMGTNFNGIVYMLRVIFVGHRPDGTTQTVHSVTLPLQMLDIEFNLDSSRGVYAITFMPYTNFDAIAYQRWLNISNAASFYTGKGSMKLGAIINSVEARLNKLSQNYFNEASALLGQTRGEEKYGRLVRYQITIPEEWEDFQFTGGNVGNATETVFKKDAPTGIEKPGTPVDAHMSVAAGELLTVVIDRIFSQVHEIAQLAGGKPVREGRSVVFYNHLVSLTSTDDEVVVHVDVIPFRVPNVYLEEKPVTTMTSGQDNIFQMVDGVRVPKHYFELDYIFTGKNSQVLNFDMKLQAISTLLRSNLGLGVDAMAGITGLDQAEADPKKKINKAADLVLSRKYDPLIMPLNTADELNNFRNYSDQVMKERGPEIKKDKQDYTRNLSMFYAVSPVQTALTIKGNPLIMEKFHIGDFVPHRDEVQAAAPASAPITTDKAKYRRVLDAKILKDNERGGTAGDLRQEGGYFVVSTNPLGGASYVTTPVFFKINIKGPNVDYVTSETVHGEEFSKAVLYENYYRVMYVSNVIENGNFTQDLTLWQHNVFGFGELAAQAGKTPQKI